MLHSNPLLSMSHSLRTFSYTLDKLLSCERNQKHCIPSNDWYILRLKLKTRRVWDEQQRTLSAFMILCTLENGSKDFPSSRTSVTGSFLSLFRLAPGGAWTSSSLAACSSSIFWSAVPWFSPTTRFSSSSAPVDWTVLASGVGGFDMMHEAWRSVTSSCVTRRVVRCHAIYGGATSAKPWKSAMPLWICQALLLFGMPYIALHNLVSFM